ncbi:MAG: polysaccharide biosynthesis tyrosine autokinase [Vicinamibacterales bacterium]|jgi:capsular exopolysaccharide synthesis family protein|nr:hypothetical protein [Acidobacteriota bacterium]MDP6374141.1 polysaccharide biosynthesis tyrosine autokinase [Vicinamibacterales bacterium]MDP6610361.1 polysaccharide biosynthesis tyrosine autokinase [Vicinamibacterales bacterium]HAK56990.1 hypothetical protein [Acidobacteriota bacterium]
MRRQKAKREPFLDMHPLREGSAAVRRHPRLVITVFLVTVVSLMPQSDQAARMYEARARLLIEDEQAPSLALGERFRPVQVWERVWDNPQVRQGAQSYSLQSATLVTRVVERLSVDLVPEFTRQRAAPTGVLATFFSARAAAVSWLRSLPSTAVNLVMSGGTGPPNASRPAAVAQDTRAADYVGAYLGRLRIVPVPRSYFIDVFFTATDPNLAALVADAHAEEYVSYNLELRRAQVEQTLAQIDTAVTNEQQAVEESERALATYAGARDIRTVDGQPSVMAGTLKAANDALIDAMERRLREEAVYSQVRGLTATSEKTPEVAVIARHPAVRDARVMLADLQRERASLSLRYGDLHPTTVALDARIESAADALEAETDRAIQTIRREYELARAQERQLQAELDAQMRRMAEASGQAMGAFLLDREAESHRGIYAALLERQNQLRVMRDTTENNAALLERADVPANPVIRSSTLGWSLAILLGMVLSVGLAVVLDANDTIKTPEGLDRALQTPILSVLPAVRDRRFRKRRGSRQDDRLSLLSGTVAYDFGEAVRMLRSALTLTGEAGSSRTVSVTSAAPGDGKTTVAVNLAAAFALGGAKVLLIDADMRRPSVHKRLGLENATGLSQVIARQARLGDAIQATNDPHLFVLTSGHLPPNPSELLASVTMNDATGSFEWVIVDTPPALAVTDPVLVAKHADEVVFVVSENRTLMSQAKHALERLRAVGVRVTGTVLNHSLHSQQRAAA